MKKMPDKSSFAETVSFESTRREFLVRATAAAVGTAIIPGAAAVGQNQQIPASANHSGTVHIQVGKDVRHTMAGGAGASWHAIGPTAYFYGQNSRNAKGSGWGGNPPLEFLPEWGEGPPTGYRQQWDDLERHFQWLGLDFVRVELEMRMYEPEKGKFDWQNSEMKTLYRILDICQQNHADVFLTQMWQDVAWNRIDGAARVNSAPKSVPDFADGLGTLMEHLVHNKDYTCIHWLCIVNEPADDWGWWLGPKKQPQDLMPAIRAVRAELDRRKIPVAISGPDFIYEDNLKSPIFDWDDPAVGAFDLHYYSENDRISMDWIKPSLKKARARRIPIFLSEFGSFVGSNLDGSDPTMTVCADYPNQLFNAEKVLLGLNLGLDGFNRWSLTNRGDLDGNWQLVRTWDPIRWNYLPRVTPEPVPYYTYGILTRFIAKHSDILAIDLGSPQILASALLSPAGHLTVIVLNKSAQQEEITLGIPEGRGKSDFYKYQVTEAAVKDSKYQMSPLASFQIHSTQMAISDKLPPKSITVYSNYHLSNDDPGIMTE
ncbi:MAG TPA: cellulase family glycosylhydrolase [Acidobacteriaceae bacterium]|nr:cellulase family glycosylhydrolase [Acidobacteriaceae bacterium]